MFGRFKKKKEAEAKPPMEFERANPLKLLVNGRIKVDIAEISHLDFVVTEIEVHEFEIGSRTRSWADYHIAAVCHDKNISYCADGRVELTIRFIEKERAIPGDTHWVYVLWQGEDLEWDSGGEFTAEKFIDMAYENPTNLVIPEAISFDDEDYDGKTWRRQDGATEAEGWVGRSVSYQDADGNGTIEPDEVETHGQEVYDFEDSENSDNVLFVHLSKDTGYCRLMIGYGSSASMFSNPAEGAA